MHYFYALLLAGLGLHAAQAQTTVTIGPRLGGNLATATFDNPDLPSGGGISSSYSHGYIGGVQLGLAASFGWGHWAFQPALVFTQKGLSQQASVGLTLPNGSTYREQYDIGTRIHYLELPLNLVYGLNSDGQGLQFFAGPYVAVGVGGQAAYDVQANYTDPYNSANNQEFKESLNVPFKFGSTYEDNPNQTDPVAQVRQFDAGLNLGVGYRRGPVQVQLGYGLGLLNVQPDYPASYQMPNQTGYLRTVQLAATYFFDHWPAARK